MFKRINWPIATGIIFALVFVAFCAVFAPTPIRVRLMGANFQDFGIYGFEKGTAAQIKFEFSSQGQFRDFDTLTDARAHFESTYHPNQKVMFNCLNPDGTGPYKKTVKVSQLKDFDCQQGYIYTYKWPLY